MIHEITILPGFYEWVQLGSYTITPLIIGYAAYRFDRLHLKRQETDRKLTKQLDYANLLFAEIKELTALENWNNNPEFLSKIESIKILLNDQDDSSTDMLDTLELVVDMSRDKILKRLSKDLTKIRNFNG